MLQLPRPKWYHDLPARLETIIGGTIAASIGLYGGLWVRQHWTDVWPWLLLLVIPLLLVWLVVRVIRHAWKA